MKIKIQYTFALLVFLSGLQTAFAQKKDENIGTEVVNVVKPYTPTISDAFKVKETPTLEDEDNTKKENIKYSIFSFPVASTFTPSKGRAAGVDKSAQETLFKNYVTAGLGNYLNLFGELYITQDIGDNDYAAGMVKHLSSQGGIRGVEAEDGFMNSSIDLTYGSKLREFSWNVDLGYQLQNYHYYGLPEPYGTFLTPDQRRAIYNRVDEGFVYNDFYAGGKIKFNESIFNEMTLKYERFWDKFDSQENRFVAKPSFQFTINENTIKTDVIADYVGGTFGNATAVKYGFANFGVKPSFAMNKDNWSFNLGASVYYSLNTNVSSDSKLFVYPNATAALKVVGDIMVFYVGADGGLDQNSYRSFSNENPYLSPNILVAPTDRQYDLFAGLRGKLSNYISYNVKGSVMSEKHKPLFISNPFDESNPYDEFGEIKEQYRFGNSFSVIYDDIRTVSFSGELKADISKNFSAGINGELHKYATRSGSEAWNLPEIKFGANFDVNITPKLYAGADVFFVGERKDQLLRTNVIPLIPVSNTVTLDSYFDANAHVGYKFNERFAAFFRVNNIANQNYEKWLNYPVQSLQIMLGGSYKFDF